MATINRRGLLKNSSRLLLGSGLSGLVPSRSANAQDSPHFYFQVMMTQGWDPSYLFDARPLAMRDAGLMHNYLAETPQLWTGRNGGTLWATSLCAPFKPYFDEGRISICNGVFMTTSFDGHDQNKNIALTGNPFGGNALFPFLNQSQNPMDALQLGNLYGVSFLNGERIVKISGDSVNALADAAEDMLNSSQDPLLSRFIAARLNHLGHSGETPMAMGARGMNDALSGVHALREKLAEAKVEADENSIRFQVKAALKYFAKGLTSSAILVDDEDDLDTHDAASAMQQPAKYKIKGEKIGTILQTLAETEYQDTGTSFLDHTTILMTSEFGRTVRQNNAAVANTGTDHNTLANSVIIGGKGIKGGLVVGQSDWHTPEEELTAAHLRFDGNRLKKMGRTFDYSTLNPASATPVEYAPEDYLNYTSLANTVFQLFAVPPEQHWDLKRNGPKAKVLDNLLA